MSVVGFHQTSRRDRQAYAPSAPHALPVAGSSRRCCRRARRISAWRARSANVDRLARESVTTSSTVTRRISASSDELTLQSRRSANDLIGTARQVNPVEIVCIGKLSSRSSRASPSARASSACSWRVVNLIDDLEFTLRHYDLNGLAVPEFNINGKDTDSDFVIDALPPNTALQEAERLPHEQVHSTYRQPDDRRKESHASV